MGPMALASRVPRVVGLEVEHALRATALSPVSGERSLDETAGDLIEGAGLDRRRQDGGYLPNGARFYIDSGTHPEYCSPECTTLDDLLATDRAGSELLRQLAHCAESQGQRLHIYRNNRSVSAISWGTHENYEVSSTHFGGDPSELARLIAVHLVTRQIFTGTGGVISGDLLQHLGESGHPNAVTPTQQGRMLCVSPKGVLVSSVFSASACDVTPMVKSAGSDNLGGYSSFRFQVVCGDSNMSETATALKVGTTRLLIAVLEADPHALDDIVLQDPCDEMRQVARDVFTSHSLTLANDPTPTTALQLQRRLLAACSTAADAGSVSAEEASILPMWKETLDALERNSPLASRRIDWLCKNTLITLDGLRSGTSPLSDRAVQVDATYSDLVHGLRDKLEAQGQLERLTDPERVAHLVTQAPQGGRPEVRGYAVAAIGAAGALYQGEWDRLFSSFRGKPPRPGVPQVNISDPRVRLADVKERLDALVAVVYPVRQGGTPSGRTL